MSLMSKDEHKFSLDVGAWMFNIVTSVGIIIVNKALMATYGFTFATTLTGLHFAATTTMTVILKRLGYIQSSPLPVSYLMKFILFANFSIVGMNVSLMWNSVEFYQIAKLSMIPVSCFLEVVLDSMQYSRDTKLSILVVLLGVGICTVNDMSVNAKGFIAAFIAVWSTSLQQYGVIPAINGCQREMIVLQGEYRIVAETRAQTLCLKFDNYFLTESKLNMYKYNNGFKEVLHAMRNVTTLLLAILFDGLVYFRPETTLYQEAAYDQNLVFGTASTAALHQRIVQSVNRLRCRPGTLLHELQRFKFSYVHFLQRKHSIGSFNLLGQTAPPQAATLLLAGPFVDYWLTDKRVDAYNYTSTSIMFIVLSCAIAIGTNLSQFICIGRFTAVSFQVLGHMKTILVLTLGFLFFGKEGLNLHVVVGMMVAIVGMIWYGHASSRLRGKERDLSPSNDKTEEEVGLVTSDGVDDKV
ncbi:hypothetical protein OROMI_005274 [Orobanche minor]